MTLEDLRRVDQWLREPHVARWFLPETTTDAELEKYRLRIEDPFSATTMCLVEMQGEPVGFCQWYRWEDYLAAAQDHGARRGDIGADYPIGDPTALGRGVGTWLVNALVAAVRHHYPGADLVIAPEAANLASRRVLEKNGFALIGVRPLRTEPHDRPMALYRLSSPPTTSIPSDQ